MERLEFHRQTDRAMSSFYSRSWFGTLPFRSLAVAIRTESIAQINTHVNIDGGALGNNWTDERCGMDPNEAKQRVQDVLKVRTTTPCAREIRDRRAEVVERF